MTPLNRGKAIQARRPEWRPPESVAERRSMMEAQSLWTDESASGRTWLVDAVKELTGDDILGRPHRQEDAGRQRQAQPDVFALTGWSTQGTNSIQRPGG